MDLYFNSDSPFTRWIIQQKLLHEPFIVIDIGCQGGEHPRWELLEDRLEFYGFDPIAEVIDELRQYARPGRRYFEYALGDDDGKREFFIAEEPTQSSFEPQGIGQDAARFRTVPIRRLDTLFAEGMIPPADYIKLDCEGFEPVVLRGARNYLRASGAHCVTSETSFNVSQTYTRSHFHSVNEIVVEHRLIVFDLNLVRTQQPAFRAARAANPLPKPDPMTEVPHLDVGRPGTIDAVFCRDFVAEAVNPTQYYFAEVPQGPPSVDRLIKTMINFELHGLMDCAVEIAVHFRPQLQDRFPVDTAIDLLLRRPPHARNTADVVNCLSMIAELRSLLIAARFSASATGQKDAQDETRHSVNVLKKLLADLMLENALLKEEIQKQKTTKTK